MANLGKFCIDRFEGSLEVLSERGDWEAWSPYHNPGTRRARARSIRGAVPQGYISAEQAALACNESGKRLCADDEWLFACRGASLRRFPYGHRRYEGRFTPASPACNESRSLHPAVEIFGPGKEAFDHLESACINLLPRGLARTGAYQGCSTPEGVFDLMGNLH